MFYSFTGTLIIVYSLTACMWICENNVQIPCTGVCNTGDIDNSDCDGTDESDRVCSGKFGRVQIDQFVGQARSAIFITQLLYGRLMEQGFIFWFNPL